MTATTPHTLSPELDILITTQAADGRGAADLINGEAEALAEMVMDLHARDHRTATGGRIDPYHCSAACRRADAIQAGRGLIDPRDWVKSDAISELRHTLIERAEELEATASDKALEIRNGVDAQELVRRAADQVTAAVAKSAAEAVREAVESLDSATDGAFA